MAPTVDAPPEGSQQPGPLAASGLPVNASIEMAKAGDGHGRIGASARKKAIKQKGAKDVGSKAEHRALGQKDEAIKDLERMGRAKAMEGYEASSARMGALEKEFASRVDGSI
jgi:hypothetical protein